MSSSSLSGFVYADTGVNGFNDGIKQTGELGISGVLITLDGGVETGNYSDLTTTTDANGFYRFSNLRPGTYRISESQPSGWT